MLHPVALQVLLPDKRAGKLKLQAAGTGRPIAELYGSLTKVCKAAASGRLLAIINPTCGLILLSMHWQVCPHFDQITAATQSSVHSLKDVLITSPYPWPGRTKQRWLQQQFALFSSVTRMVKFAGCFQLSHRKVLSVLVSELC